MHITFRRAPLAAVLLLGAAVLSACGGTAVPTIPPIASQPPDASGAPDDPTPVGGQAQGLVIVALNVAFEPVALTAKAGAPFTITFQNKDQGSPHDLVVKDAAGNELAKTQIRTGPAQDHLTVGPLAAGAYSFACTVHPNMFGTITVE